MSHNFWGFLIAGWTEMFTVLLSQLPDSEFNSVIGAGATTFYYALAPILFFVGPFFNLNMLFLVAGIILGLEVVKQILGLAGLIAKVVGLIAKIAPFL